MLSVSVYRIVELTVSKLLKGGMPVRRRLVITLLTYFEIRNDESNLYDSKVAMNSIYE